MWFFLFSPSLNQSFCGANLQKNNGSSGNSCNGSVSNTNRDFYGNEQMDENLIEDRHCNERYDSCDKPDPCAIDTWGSIAKNLWQKWVHLENHNKDNSCAGNYHQFNGGDKKCHSEYANHNSDKKCDSEYANHNMNGECNERNLLLSLIKGNHEMIQLWANFACQYNTHMSEQAHKICKMIKSMSAQCDYRNQYGVNHDKIKEMMNIFSHCNPNMIRDIICDMLKAGGMSL